MGVLNAQVGTATTSLQREMIEVNFHSGRILPPQIGPQDKGK